MDIISQLNLAAAGQITLAGILVGIVVEVAKRGIKDKSTRSWALPLIAVVVGMIAGVVACAVSGESNWAGSAVMGVIVGAASSGIFDLSTGTVITAKTKIADQKAAKQQAADKAAADAHAASIKQQAEDMKQIASLLSGKTITTVTGDEGAQNETSTK